MAINKRLLVKPPSSGGITPSEHFGVVLYEGDGASSHSINGGKFGAAAYTTNSGVVTIPANITNTNKHSLSIWLNTSTTSGTQTVFEFGTGNQILFRTHSTDSNKANFGTGGWFDHGITFNANTWYHLVITFNSGNPAKIYVNGSLAHTTGNKNKGASDSANYLGANNSSGGNNFKGKLDQFRIFLKELSASEVSTLYAETAATVESLSPLGNETVDTLQVLGDTSCTSLYKLENNENDESGNYNGTGNAVQYAAGRYGQAVKFGSTTTSYLDITKATTPTTSSISFWLKTSYSDNQWRVIADGGGSQSSGTGWAIFITGNGTKINPYFTNGQTGYSQSVEGNKNIADGVWHHVVLTMASDNGFVLYLDGSSHLSGTRTRWTSGDTHSVSNVRFGNIIATSANANNQFYGEIDQIRTFNKSLSSSEVTTLYNENALVASYRFEGNANDDMRTYNGTTSNVTYENALGFTPDFVWIKERSAAESHRWARLCCVGLESKWRNYK